MNIWIPPCSAESSFIVCCFYFFRHRFVPLFLRLYLCFVADEPQVAKVFAPEVQPATTSGGSGGARKSSKTANTLATKFRDNLTTLM